MDILLSKHKLIKLIIETEEVDLIQKFLSIAAPHLSKENLDEIVGSKPDGTPYTLAELKENIRKSEEDYKNGNFMTHEEFEKESESW